MNVVRYSAWACSVLLHAAAAAMLVDLTGGASLNSGSGNDILKIEQGFRIDNVTMLGDALETIQASAAQAPSEQAEVKPPVDELKTVDEPQETVRPNDELPVTDTKAATSEEVAAAMEKPEEVKPAEEAKQPSQQVVASQEIQEQNASAAQSGGDTTRLTAYLGKLRTALERHKVNPGTRQKGSVLLRFTVDASGNVLSQEIVSSSGSKQLDDAALASLKRAAPFPPLPADVASQPLVVSVPFKFVTR